MGEEMKVPKEKPKIPDVIWLQWYGNDDETEGPEGVDGYMNITWCGQEKVFNNDIRYVRDKRYGKKKDRR